MFMAKADGPLFSLEAKGTTKKTLTYQKRKGTSVVYQYKKPGSVNSYYPSATQNNARFLYILAQVGWANISQAKKDSCKILADAESRPMSGFNYYVKKMFETNGAFEELLDWWPMNIMENNRVINKVRSEGILRTSVQTGQPYLSVVKSNLKRLPYVIYNNSLGGLIWHDGSVDYNIHKDDLGLMFYVRPYKLPSTFIGLYAKYNPVDDQGYILRIMPTGELNFILSDGVTQITGTTVKKISLGQISCIVFDIVRKSNVTIYVNGENWCKVDCSALDGVDIATAFSFVLITEFYSGLNPQIQGAHFIRMPHEFNQLSAQLFTRLIKPNTPVTV